MQAIFYLLGVVVSFILMLEVWRRHNIENPNSENENEKYDSLNLILVTSFLVSIFSWFSVVLILIWLYIQSKKDKLINYLYSKKNLFDIIIEQNKTKNKNKNKE